MSNGNNNGHQRNGTGNGLVHVNGNGAHSDPAIIDRATTCSGTGCRPPSRRPSPSPSTPRWPPSARAGAGAPSTTSKGTSSSTKPTTSSAMEGGDTSWSET